ncbi:MAG TPA: plastocyanin/azurin family copper-binding protein [Solirubrobacterales bacterium]|jgi:plastocyanin|nr:plastocyanin/azurin family copper-binding protein [Solirubrobacterales bacterium]
MSTNEKLFYACGIVLAVSALVVTFAGLKLKDFPGRALPVVVLWFAVFVVAATTFATRYSGEEHEAKAAEYKEFNEKLEEGESVGGFSNEGGALGGEREEGEQEAEEAAEGSVQGEEPVGPTEGSQEGKGGQTPEPRGAEDEPTQSGEGDQTENPTGETSGKQGSGGKAEASATTLKLAADPAALAFDKESLTAKAGKVTIDFENPSAIPHNVVIEEDGKELAGFEPISEGEKAATADLKAGTYTYYCSVPGHRQAGMEGQLTVK